MVVLSASDIFLEYVCPALGSITAWLMWLAPLQDVQQALTANDLGPLNAIPWAVMLGNTLGWVSYGLLRHNWFIFFANAPGFVLSIYFNATAVKLLHYAAATTTSPASSGRLVGGGSSAPTAPLTRSADAAVPGSVVVVVKAPMSEPTEGSTDSPLPAAEPPLASMVVMPVVAPTTNSSLPLPPRNIYQQRLQTQERLVLAMVLVWMAVLTAVIAVQSWDDDTRQLVTGLTVNANLVFFYGAPLSTIRHVWRTRSSASLHGPTVVRNTLNGVFWMIYGVAVLDPYVAVPNALGALMGGVQIALRLVFPQKAKLEDDGGNALPPALAAIPEGP